MTVSIQNNNSANNTNPAILNTDAVSATTASVAPGNSWQTGNFASITDATSLILKHINYPDKRRSFICALQGIANGREEFQASHQTIARRLGHQGQQHAAEMTTYRQLNALKRFQERSGYILFDIEQGGGEEHKRTTYFDCLTGLALRLRDRAVRMKKAQPGLAKSPLGKIMESIVDEAVGELLPFAESRIAATNRTKKSWCGGGGWSRRRQAKHAPRDRPRRSLAADRCLFR